MTQAADVSACRQPEFAKGTDRVPEKQSDTKAPPQAQGQSNFLFMLPLIFFVAVSMVGAAMFTPSIPAIALEFGEPVSTVQLTITVYLIGFALSQILVGVSADRFGRRAVLVGGFLIFAVSSAVCAIAPNVETLIAARLFQAASGTVGLVVSRAMVGDRFTRSESGRYMAYIGMASGLMPMLSPLVGGFIEVSAGWRAVFYLLTGLGGLAFLLALLGRKDRPTAEAGTSRSIGRYVSDFKLLIRDRRFASCTVATAATGSMFFMFLASGAIVMIGPKGVTPDIYGFYALAMPTGYVTGNFLSSQLISRIGIDRAIASGLWFGLIGATALFALGLAGRFDTVSFVLPLFVMGIGNGLAVPAAFAGAIGAEPRLAGTASGLTGFIQFSIAALVNPLAGLVRHASLLELGAIMFGFALIGLLIYARLRVREPSSDAGDAGVQAPGSN